MNTSLLSNKNLTEKFHMARLAIFNAEILSEFQKEIENCSQALSIRDKVIRNNFNDISYPPHLINQSTHLGVAYTVLVLLIESLKCIDEKLIDRVIKTGWIDDPLYTITKKSGPRDIDKNKKE